MVLAKPRGDLRGLDIHVVLARSDLDLGLFGLGHVSFGLDILVLLFQLLYSQ